MKQGYDSIFTSSIPRFTRSSNFKKFARGIIERKHVSHTPLHAKLSSQKDLRRVSQSKALSPIPQSHEMSPTSDTSMSGVVCFRYVFWIGCQFFKGQCGVVRVSSGHRSQSEQHGTNRRESVRTQVRILSHRFKISGHQWCLIFV